MNKFLLTLLTIILTTSIQARTLTAATNGNWSSPSTWSPSGTPSNGDIIVIPFGKTVSLNTNENSLKTSTLEIRIAGTLNFLGNGSKLWINDRSVIYVYTTGVITANENSQGLTIGSTQVLNGPLSGTTTITGPSIANSSSSTNNTSNSNNATGFAPFAGSTLPVQFIAFTAVRRSSDVLVQWATAQEADALSFEVEMSQDGRNWSAVGSVAAAGNSNSERKYSFVARSLPTGSLQFRIKQVDIDGKFTYTAIRTVKGNAEGSIKLNALNGRLLLQFGEEVKGATVRFLNINGQVLQEQRIASAIGQVLVPTNVKGAVVVAVMNENEIAVSRQLIF